MTDPEHLRELLQPFVDAGRLPGAVAVRAHQGEPVVVAVGNVATDAIVRIQSMTKPITALATLRLVEAGRLGLDDPVTTWLPELSGRRVLRAPDGPLDRTVPADRDITVRDLLTCQSGYGIPMDDCPLLDAMRANETEAGPEPVTLGADEWVAALADLPLAFQPGRGWRYHHSFGLLGVLVSRVVGMTLDDYLRADLFERIGMPDTGFWVPEDKHRRLPAAYRLEDGAPVETEPAGGGFYAGPPPFDVSHTELVSTAADFAWLAQLLRDGFRLPDGTPLITADHVAAMTSDQVAAESKTPDSFFPGFWSGNGWGYGVGIDLVGEHAGRFGWSGGQGTDFFVDPGAGYGILLTQVELSPETFEVVGAFQASA